MSDFNRFFPPPHPGHRPPPHPGHRPPPHHPGHRPSPPCPPCHDHRHW